MLLLLFTLQCAKRAHCDFGLYVGAGPDNYNILPSLSNEAVAMKMYLNKTYSSLQLDSMEVWMQVRLGMGTGHICCH